MGFEVKIISRSISEQGMPLVTAQFKYPRFIHAEFMTHREFSRNASSSRAIPVAKMIEQVRNDPAMPIHWGANQPGMQADNQLHGAELEHVQTAWKLAAMDAANWAEKMSKVNCHKQVANRILEPYQWMHVIATTSNTSNFFGLRRHKDAQPEIKLVADLWYQALEEYPVKLIKQGDWHLPYIAEADRQAAFQYLKIGRIIRSEPSDAEVNNLLIAMSAARCARVSYLTHDGNLPTVQQDLDLYQRLVGAQPLHASPTEHQATPDVRQELILSDPDGEQGEHVYEWAHKEEHGNLKGWRQFRKMLPGEYIH